MPVIHHQPGNHRVVDGVLGYGPDGQPVGPDPERVGGPLDPDGVGGLAIPADGQSQIPVGRVRGGSRGDHPAGTVEYRDPSRQEAEPGRPQLTRETLGSGRDLNLVDVHIRWVR